MSAIGWVAVAALGLSLVGVTILWLQARRASGALGSAAEALGDSAIEAAKKAAAAEAEKAAADARAKVQAAQDAASKVKHGSLSDILRRLGAGK